MASFISFILILLSSLLSASEKVEIHHDLTMSKAPLYELPRFWTNTGFCPMGKIDNHEISKSLLSPDVETNLQFIGALPNSGITSVRVHWLLHLIHLVHIERHLIPVVTYDFTQLDTFLDRVVKANLSVGFELMGNPNGRMFNWPNVSHSALWEDLVFSIGRRYKIRYGLKTLQRWQFETWNEPDLRGYNLLNFTLADYIDYVRMIRRGLDAVGRTANNTHLELSGPAGLFKNESHHPLCWGILQYCNNQKTCPFDRITFHRKGNGNGGKEIVEGGLTLARTLQKDFPQLKSMRISNNEADPISGWSTPRPFQSDVRYAAILVDTVLRHWNAKLNSEEFLHLDSISHDNAFLSYHPHEFGQRTLLARFQMNETNPPHSQFIQKPVYGALGLLGNLGAIASDVTFNGRLNVSYMFTFNRPDKSFYNAIIVSSISEGKRIEVDMNITLPKLENDEHVAFIVEGLETDITDPVKIWDFYGAPAYPNNTLRKLMRQHQVPYVLDSAILKKDEKFRQSRKVELKYIIKAPAVILIRICSSNNGLPPRQNIVSIKEVNSLEVIVYWKDAYHHERCIKTYEVFFKAFNQKEWQLITSYQHVPFLSFHFQPDDGLVRGSYKVRGLDIFNRYGPYSDVIIFG